MQLPDGTDLGEWRLLRERFTEFSRAASGLTAEWVGWPDGGKWTVTGVDDLTIREFQAVCFRGVQLLGGNAGNGSDWVAWLDALRIDPRVGAEVAASELQMDWTAPPTVVRVRNVCQASADYCSLRLADSVAITSVAAPAE